LYYFSSEEAKEKFEEDPVVYISQGEPLKVHICDTVIETFTDTITASGVPASTAGTQGIQQDHTGARSCQAVGNISCCFPRLPAGADIG